MTMLEPDYRGRATSRSAFEALAFEAPFVVEKLVNDRIVDTVTEGEKLFTEAVKYIVLSQSSYDVIVGMYSVRVDEAWHQFILYTAEYMNFCQRFFGTYVSHRPRNAPPSHVSVEDEREALTFNGFRSRYETVFGEPLPDIWYDERNITVARRVFNDVAGRLTVSQHDGLAELLDDADHIVLSVNDLASEALKFIAQTVAFYVRELPGDLIDDEKTALIEALVASRVLRVAA